MDDPKIVRGLPIIKSDIWIKYNKIISLMVCLSRRSTKNEQNII